MARPPQPEVTIAIISTSLEGAHLNSPNVRWSRGDMYIFVAVDNDEDDNFLVSHCTLKLVQMSKMIMIQPQKQASSCKLKYQQRCTTGCRPHFWRITLTSPLVKSGVVYPFAGNMYTLVIFSRTPFAENLLVELCFLNYCKVLRCACAQNIQNLVS